MSERRFVVRTPPEQMRWLDVSAPERFLGADMIEIRVQLTPLRFWDKSTTEMERCGESVYSEVRLVRVEAKDSRMVFHLVRELIRNLLREYLQIEF